MGDEWMAGDYKNMAVAAVLNFFLSFFLPSTDLGFHHTGFFLSTHSIPLSFTLYPLSFWPFTGSVSSENLIFLRMF